MVSLDEFLVGLRSLAVLPQAEFLRLRSNHPTEADNAHVAQLAQRLVDDGRITPYQCDQLLQGQWHSLFLGEYLVLEPIGQGGMGQVFLALHRHMHRRVAIKRVRADLADKEGVVPRFQREIETIAQLSHPNVVRAYDAGEDHGMLYLVMEFVEGETLLDLMKRGHRFSLVEAVDHIAQAARGLRAIHAAGIIHRDIKPSNLLRDHQGTIKILDLGLARVTSPARGIVSDHAVEPLTQTNQVLGTVDYMAPEQAEGGREIDHRVDLYSLGCCLFHLLADRPVYPRGTWLDCLLAHREAALPSLCGVRPDVPAELDKVFQRLIAKRPEDRFGSADELLRALAPVIRDESEAAEASEDAESDLAVVPYVPLIEPPFRARSLRTARRVWLAGFVGVLATLTFAAMWFWWPDGDEQDPGQHAVVSPPPVSAPMLEPILSLVGHTNTIECVAFLPGGTQLVSSDDDQQVLVWDLVAGQLGYRLAKGDDTGPALAVDDAGKWLATAADTDLLKWWDLSTRKVVTRLKGHHVAFSRAGDLLAAALHEDPIALYDTTAHQEVGELVGHGAWVCALVFSNDGTTLISGDEDGVLRLWDVPRRAQRKAVTCDVQINSLAVVPDQDCVAAGCADGWVRIWNIKTYELEASWPAHEGPAWGTACSHDGRLLASAGADGNIVVWDMSVRRQLVAWHAHEGESVAVTFSPDDKRLASGGDDQTVKLWDVEMLTPHQ